MRVSRLTWSLICLLTAAPLAADTTLLYDFEGSTQGFEGKTSTAPIGATHGKQALAIDTTGLTGWQQDLCSQSNNEDWSDAVEFLADVYLPAGTKAAAQYVQFIPTFSGPKDSFYKLGQAELTDGENHVSFPVKGGKVATPWKLLLIINSGAPIPGKIYVDNIRMRTPGKPGKLDITVKDATGSPVAGVVVAAGSASATTDPSGKVHLELPGDSYQAEILGADIEGQTFQAVVPASKSAEQTVVVKRAAAPWGASVLARVYGGTKVVSFDAHKVYGHNMAMWSGLDAVTSELQTKKLREVHAELIRIPSGEYGNRWNWRTGGIYKLDGTGSLDWTPEANWPAYKQMFQQLGPQAEALMILNTFLGTPDDMVAWVQDARDAGIKVRYVELGNEPDLDPERFFDGRKGGSTSVDEDVKVTVPFARAIRKAFPDIKILGPVTAQIDDRECPGKHPWECNQYDATGQLKDDPAHRDWAEKFLDLYSKQGDLLDGLSVHSYPYYPKWLGQATDVWAPAQAFSKVRDLTKYMGMYHTWMRKYYPTKADRMDIALTEYNMQVDETWVTADVEDAVWNANYLAEFIKNGGTIANSWDINTLKPADGGGHGMLDPNNDPNRPYAERARYWMFKMMASNFTGTMVQAQSSDPKVQVYAAKDRGRTTVMFINQDPDHKRQVTLQLSGAPSASQMRVMTLSHRNYQWSKVLYRAVLNEDPTAKELQKIATPPAETNGWRVLNQTLDPMSVTMVVFQD
jgi:hypothetical protein